MKIIENIKKIAGYLLVNPYMPEYEKNRLNSFFNPVSFLETKNNAVFGSNFFSIGEINKIIEFCKKEGIDYEEKLSSFNKEEKIIFGINTKNKLFTNINEEIIINYNLYFFKI